MIPFLTYSYNSIYPNYAIAIILLTIVIKAALYPLTKKQFDSMKKMQVLQPQFKELKVKYKKDPQRIQQETIKLYKENNVNPLGGCLPLIIQLPFLFALFYTMSSDAFNALITAPGVFPGLTTFWLPNLADPDHSYILPVLIGVSTFLSQKFSTVDAQQQKIMMFMPAIMVVICVKMPAGVLLYWAVSQIIGTAQQYFIMNPKKETAISKGATK
ncbi:membrane protein insertase YidC [bacterium]|nr:membrane protein insertase YidC [bacterium]